MAASAIQKKKILIVANPNVRQFISGRLASAGYETYVSGRGDYVIEAVAREDFDLIITAAQLPVQSGFNIVERLRVTEDYPTPIIVLLNEESTMARTFLKVRGVDAIMKPAWTIEELLTEVGRILRENEAFPRRQMHDAKEPL